MYRDSITLRHVLSHSSGLGKTGRAISFKPGSAYCYSAQGFMFLKEVLESVTGEPFERLAQRLVFRPLRMKHSSFVRNDAFNRATSNGHVRAIAPAAIFGALAAAVFIVLASAGLVIARLWKKRWALTRPVVVGFLGASFALPAASVFISFGRMGMSEFAWLLALCGGSLMVLFCLLFFPGRDLIVRKTGARALLCASLSVLWCLLTIATLLVAASKIRNIPVPTWPDYEASPAGTLMTSAQELALFAVELGRPKHLRPATAALLRAPQITLSDRLAWGMGPGILHTDSSEYALWQWGQHIDFQTIMVIFPKGDYGIVVCTNNDLLNPDAAFDIARRALGEGVAPLRSAIHLRYDSR